MSWKIFEKECVQYLNDKYGLMFEQKGESDSTVSDILFNNGMRSFYIESKMPISQCGQFVLIPDFKKHVFIYSPKNKTKENEYAIKIVDFMDNKFHEFCNSGTTGLNIDMPKSVFYNWIISYYKNKGVEFFITKSEKRFIVFPIEKIYKYFNVTAKYREKKSGSSSLNNSNKVDFDNAMKNMGINYSFDGLDIISIVDLDGIKITGNNYGYLLRKNGSSYSIRKLSNTRNANVIFSIELMPFDDNQQKEDILEFEKRIKK